MLTLQPSRKLSPKTPPTSSSNAYCPHDAKLWVLSDSKPLTSIEAYEYAAASLQLEEELIDEWNRALGYGDSTGRSLDFLPAPRSVGELEVAVASVRVHIAEARIRLMDDLGDVLTVDGNPI